MENKKDFTTVYAALWNEVAHIHIRWREYCALFDTNKSCIELMNRIAPLFFLTIQDALWRDIILKIANMLGSKKSCGKENLTFKHLPDFITDKARKLKVETAIKDAEEKTSFSTDWRHRDIAHRDLNLVLQNGKAVPLAFINRNKIEEALCAFKDILDKASALNNNFDAIVINGGSEVLLRLLNDGDKASQEKCNRLKNGNYELSDLQPIEVK